MARRTKSESVQPSGNNCAVPGCAEPGNFRAPRSRTNLREHQWLCEVHVREFNKNWNYFEGMSQDEIYDYQRDASTGHRPTWRMDQMGGNLDRKMEEAFGRLFGDGPSPRSGGQSAPISAKTRDALAVLDLVHPTSKKAVKSQYRELVKKYHPDVNRGDRKSEETFKKITLAYQHLMAHYQEQPA